MSNLRYPVPWDVVFSLGPNIWNGSPASFDRVTATIASKLHPEPVISGWECLPESPRFVLAANHYQRPGLWIAHATSVLTQAIKRHYSPRSGAVLDPPVRWIVTANFPPLKLGPWKVPSPGDIVLTRLADAIGCYPVTFARADPAFTARTIRIMLRDARTLKCPIGIFPEGAAATAGNLSDALPGIGRLLRQFAKLGWPVVPAGIGENRGFLVRFGSLISPGELLAAPDSGELVMQRIRGSLP